MGVQQIIPASTPLPVAAVVIGNSRTHDDHHERVMADARQALLLAEAHLNAIVMAARAARDGFHQNTPAQREKLRVAVRRVHDARHELDTARFEAIGILTLNGTDLCTNDPDDMGDGLLTRLERNHYGEPDDASSGIDLSVEA